MIVPETLFEKYVEMRQSGNDIESVQQKLRAEVIQGLNRDQRNRLAKDCLRWERDRTIVQLTPEQEKAVQQATLTTTVKIRFCSACDSPNADGFTLCQVCNEPLAVEIDETQETTAVALMGSHTYYDSQSQVVLKIAHTKEQLRLQPQISPTGLKIGRSSTNFSADVDLDPFEGGSYGVSRGHAIIRFDKDNQRLIIVDTGSTNGTFLNGVKLPKHMESTLSNGDELKLGKMCFRVKIK